MASRYPVVATAALLLLGAGTLGWSEGARAAKAPTPPSSASAGGAAYVPSMEERTAAFGQIDELLRSGQSARAADALMVLVDDPSKAIFHAEAYARLGGVLTDLDLNYGALVAYEKALSLDAPAVSSAVKDAIKLADRVGDTALLEPAFGANVGLDVDAETRSRMAYLAAREAHRKGNYGTSIAVLKMVQPSDPFYPESKSLEGIILSMQGRPKDALAPLLTAARAPSRST